MTLLRIFFWLLGLVVVLGTVLVAVANREPVIFSLKPFPYEMAVPLYAVVFISVFLGLVLGWAGAKLSAIARRRRIAAEPRPSDALPTR